MVKDTWSTRELPILRAVLEYVDAGELVNLGAIREQLGLDHTQVRVAVRALYNAQFIEAHFSAGGAAVMVTDVTEKTRRELGSWPGANSIVDELVKTLDAAADDEAEPERRSKLRAGAELLGGFARDVAVAAVSKHVP